MQIFIYCSGMTVCKIQILFGKDEQSAHNLADISKMVQVEHAHLNKLFFFRGILISWSKIGNSKSYVYYLHLWLEDGKCFLIDT